MLPVEVLSDSVIEGAELAPIPPVVAPPVIAPPVTAPPATAPPSQPQRSSRRSIVREAADAGLGSKTNLASPSGSAVERLLPREQFVDVAPPSIYTESPLIAQQLTAPRKLNVISQDPVAVVDADVPVVNSTSKYAAHGHLPIRWDSLEASVAAEHGSSGVPEKVAVRADAAPNRHKSDTPRINPVRTRGTEFVAKRMENDRSTVIQASTAAIVNDKQSASRIDASNPLRKRTSQRTAIRDGQGSTNPLRR